MDWKAGVLFPAWTGFLFALLHLERFWNAMDTGSSFPVSKADVAWSQFLIVVWCRG
jgi:hypothetical protein